MKTQYTPINAPFETAVNKDTEIKYYIVNKYIVIYQILPSKHTWKIQDWSLRSLFYYKTKAII